MSHAPAATPPSPDRAAPPGRRPGLHSPGRHWRAPRRRMLAYAAGVAAAAGLAVEGCSDGTLTGTPAATAAGAESAATTGAADPAGALHTSRGSAAKPAGDPGLTWVGALHNRGLDAVLDAAHGAGAEHRATAKTRCTLVGRLTTEFLVAERARDERLRTAAAVPLGDGELARLARDAACGAATASRRPLADVAGGQTGDRRRDLGGGSNLSAAAAALLNRTDEAIWWMGSAAGLSEELTPVALAAELLPDETERAVVRSTVATARASAFYHEQRCQQDPSACNYFDPGPPPNDTRAGLAAEPRERRTGVISNVVKADAWGCLFGGLRGGLAGGPSGAAVGCFWGGIGASGGVIFHHIT